MSIERVSQRGRSVVGVVLLLSAAVMVLSVAPVVRDGLAGAFTGEYQAFAYRGPSRLAPGALLLVLTLGATCATAAALGLGGVLLLLHRQRAVVIGAGVFGLVAQIAYCSFAAGFHALAVLPCALHLLTIAAGVVCAPAGAPPGNVDSG